MSFKAGGIFLWHEQNHTWRIKKYKQLYTQNEQEITSKSKK